MDPRDPEALTNARFGDGIVTHEDVVFADDDGMLFVPFHDVEEVLDRAGQIQDTERRQVELLQIENNLRKQLKFEE